MSDHQLFCFGIGVFCLFLFLKPNSHHFYFSLSSDSTQTHCLLLLVLLTSEVFYSKFGSFLLSHSLTFIPFFSVPFPKYCNYIRVIGPTLCVLKSPSGRSSTGQTTAQTVREDAYGQPGWTFLPCVQNCTGPRGQCGGQRRNDGALL